MEKTVVLLGAGASVPAGLPQSAGLTEAALTAARGEPAMSLALNYVVSALQFNDVQGGREAQELPDIERLVSAVKMISERLSLEAAPFVREWDGQIEHLERVTPNVTASIRMELERQLADLAGIPSASGTGIGDRTRRASRVRQASGQTTKAIAELVKHLSRVQRRDAFGDLHTWLVRQVVEQLKLSDDSVVSYLIPLAKWASTGITVATLNYDLTLETASRAADVAFSRCVEQWYESGVLDRRPDRAMELIKLHGSIDWTLSGDSLETEPSDADSVRGGKQPAIIYGQREKLTPVGPFLQLLERFRSRVMDSDRLLIVGYSFRDRHIDTILERWLRVRPGARLLAIQHPGFVRLPTPLVARADVGTYSPDLQHLWKTFGGGRPWEFKPAEEGARGMMRVPPTGPARFQVLDLGTELTMRRIGSSGVDDLFDEAFQEDTEPAA